MRTKSILLVLSLAFDPAAAAIHRCVGEQGEASFSQHPCGADTRVVEAGTGAPGAAAGIRPSERRWLQQRGAERQRARETSASRRPSPRRSQGDADRQAYRCLRKRRALDALEAELRRGYRASRGPALHRRERAYRDYLSAFCS